MIETLAEIVRENIVNFRRALIISRLTFKKKNNASDLGWIWAIIKPVMYIVMFYFGITMGFKSSKDIPDLQTTYFGWLATGLVAWNYLQSMVLGGAGSFRKNRGIVTKTKFPLSTIPMITIMESMHTHLAMIAIMIGIDVFCGARPSIYWLQLPMYLAIAIVFTYFWALLTAMLNIMSADLINVIGSIKQALFWLSGILYNTRGRSGIAFKVNPITYLVEGYRDCICFKRWIWERDIREQIFFLSSFLVVVVLSLWMYGRVKKDLPQII